MTESRPGSGWHPSDNAISSTFNICPEAGRLAASHCCLCSGAPSPLGGHLLGGRRALPLPHSPFCTQQPELCQNMCQLLSLCPGPAHHSHCSRAPGPSRGPGALCPHAPGGSPVSHRSLLAVPGTPRAWSPLEFAPAIPSACGASCSCPPAPAGLCQVAREMPQFLIPFSCPSWCL